MMYYLLVYDILSSDKKRNKLNKVAKVCENYEVRVQNSVFELNITSAELLLLKSKLQTIIEKDVDSIRIYELGKKYKEKLTILGKRELLELTTDEGFFI